MIVSFHLMSVPTYVEDYEMRVEPSSTGGSKIARGIIDLLTEAGVSFGPDDE